MSPRSRRAYDMVRQQRPQGQQGRVRIADGDDGEEDDTARGGHDGAGAAGGEDDEESVQEVGGAAGLVLGRCCTGAMRACTCVQVAIVQGHQPLCVDVMEMRLPVPLHGCSSWRWWAHMAQHRTVRGGSRVCF